jgi:NADH:ubiquinone oxidoreductase subunit 4 (subunit M)
MFCGTAQVFRSGLSVFLLILCAFLRNSVCLLARVTMEDKNKAVVCCFLATSAIMLPGKEKKA